MRILTIAILLIFLTGCATTSNIEKQDKCCTVKTK